MTKVIDDAAEKACALLEAEARRIMAKYPSLHGFTDAMGSQFFVDRKGWPIDNRDSPKEAQDFLDGMADEHFRYFGSSGMQIDRSPA
jgi:hypothetical protein